MNQTNDTLLKLWETEQSILDVLHNICTEHGLRYSLAYGTLIGAVRHGGFIPWDDDIDVMMPREDYDRLIAIWDQAAPSGFLLETEAVSDDYNNNFAKIRKDHTTFLESEESRNRKHHKGIFIDVFPGDRVAPGKLSRTFQFAMFAVCLLFNRGYTSNSGGIVNVGEHILLACVPRKYYRRLSAAAGRLSRRWNDRTDQKWVFANTIQLSRVFHSPELFDQIVPILFNGKTYCAVKDWDAALRLEYGDYMQLPPEEERVWKHHPILIDFEHNYEESEGSGEESK